MNDNIVHASLNLAWLKLKGKYSLEELEEATNNLKDKDFIIDCKVHKKDCVVLDR